MFVTTTNPSTDTPASSLPHPSCPSLVVVQIISLPTASTGASNITSAWDAMDSSYPSSFDAMLASFRETVTSGLSTTACTNPATQKGGADIFPTGVVPALLDPSMRMRPTAAETIPLGSVPSSLPGWWYAHNMRQDDTTRRRAWGTQRFFYLITF